MQARDLEAPGAIGLDLGIKPSQSVHGASLGLFRMKR
jgi:hypothetical protein